MTKPIEVSIEDVNDLLTDVVNGINQKKSVVVNCPSTHERDFIANQARNLLKKGFVSKVSRDSVGSDLRVLIDFK